MFKRMFFSLVFVGVFFVLFGCKQETSTQYQIVFDTNGGEIIYTMAYEHQESLNLPTPIRSGYLFEGWYIDTSLLTHFNETMMPAENITLYAKWLSESVSITFDSMGGSAVPAQSLSSGLLLNPPENPTKEGFLFMGWYSSIYGTEPYVFDDMPEFNITLYADWATEGLTYLLQEDNQSYEVSGDNLIDAVFIQIPKRYEGKPVTTLAALAFSELGDLTEIVLPDTITTIKNSAFYNASSLSAIVLPKNLVNLAPNAFRLCYGLESIEIDENNANFQVINNVLYNKDATKLIRYPAGRSDTSYVVPNTVTVIGEDAFSSSFQLISITLGNSVTSIESHAFFYCANLTFMDIPNHVTSVALYAFRDCIGLEGVSIGSGLNTISSYLFNRCTSLSTITLPYNILSIGYGAFYDCLDLQTVYMTRSSMDGITTGALFMFINTSSQLKIYVPDAASVTVYKESSFWVSYASKIEINPS